jgi:hypothetical protein
LVPFSRPSFWLPAARKPLLRLRLLLLLLRPLKPLRLLLLRLRTLLLRPLRLLLRPKKRSNSGNGIGSVKPVQVGSGLPGFSISSRL